MRRMKMALMASLALSLTGTSAFAETVTLRTENGGVTITGELLEFDGETYVVRTGVGDLRLAADAVMCDGAGCPVIAPPLDFAISGTNELANRLLPNVLTAFAGQTGIQIADVRDGTGVRYQASMPDGSTDATINLRPETSSLALQNLLAGSSDVALTIRSVNRDEQDQFQAAGVAALQERILSVGGLVVVTPASNPLPSISIRDTARIFAGEVQNWAEVGGPDARINLYVQDSEQAVSEVFQDLVLNPFGLGMTSNAATVSSDADLDAQVANDPYAIGFKRFNSAGAARQMPIIGQCGLVVSPTEFNIKAEEYPLSYRMMAITKDAEQSELMASFLDFLTTDAARDVLSEGSTINQVLARSPVDQQGMRFASALRSNKIVDAIPRLQQMVSEMVVSERLSATFRFEAGSRDLDERAQRDAERVAALLSGEAIAGSKKVVRILGFTDSLGDPTLNQELSERRARQVRDALLSIDPDLENKVEFRPMGFGDVSPIGCDQTAQGRWVNRRVEIWVSGAGQ